MRRQSRSTHGCRKHTEDRVVYQRRVPNDLQQVLGALAPFAEAIEGLVVESTYNWYWLVDGLMAAGYQVHLANTAAIVQYAGLKYCDDESDARWLAKLLRLGLLPEGYVYPKEERPVRDLLRKRSQLVRQHTSHLQSVQNLLARNRGRSLSANEIKRLSYEEVDRLLPDAQLALAVKGSLAVMHTLDGVIALLEKAVKARTRLRPAFRPLLTVSGIGQTLGLTIMLETGAIERFAKVGNYASYCRCVGSKRISNGKKKGKGNTKNGNKYLAWAYIEAANFAVRYNPQIKRYYQRKCARTQPIVAIKAVAHKLARACYYILRDQVPFDVNKAFA
ncbi:MAG: IS110 family transposase [Chromatiaceae bacterium]